MSISKSSVEMGFMNRCTTYLIGLWFVLQPSYLHPDEHFQSLEVLAEQLFHFKGSIPWEFRPKNAARSFVPLYVFYGPIFYIAKFLMGLGLIEQPMAILRMVRVQNYLFYLIITRITLHAICRCSKMSSLLIESFVLSSYVTWSYQSHSFSNSGETILLLLVLFTYGKLIESPFALRKSHYLKSIGLGALVSLGTFNRITFPGFIVLPSITVFWQYYSSHKKSFILLLLSAAACSFIFIHIDTAVYQSSDYVVAPLNNLLYNLNESNLAVHGIHPRFTHFLINLPQIAGPGVVLLPYTFRFSRDVFKNIAALSLISGMAVLSLFKHQELRFITPLAPLLFCCFGSRSPFRKIKWQTIIRAWMLFNLLMAVVMCCLHQAGVLRALNKFHTDKEPISVHVWWKTYSPPTWMYMNRELLVSTTNFVENQEFVDEIPFHVTKNHIVDLKGAELDLLIKSFLEFEENGASLILIAPNSVKDQLNSLESTTRFKLEKKDEWKSHLDLDHIDLSTPSSLAPGLTIYKVRVS